MVVIKPAAQDPVGLRLCHFSMAFQVADDMLFLIFETLCMCAMKKNQENVS
jgi:hypothetical protein